MSVFEDAYLTMSVAKAFNLRSDCLSALIDSKNNKKLEYTNNSSAMNVSINDLPQNIIKKTINEYLK